MAPCRRRTIVRHRTSPDIALRSPDIAHRQTSHPDSQTSHIARHRTQIARHRTSPEIAPRSSDIALTSPDMALTMPDIALNESEQRMRGPRRRFSGLWTSCIVKACDCFHRTTQCNGCSNDRLFFHSCFARCLVTLMLPQAVAGLQNATPAVCGEL